MVEVSPYLRSALTSSSRISATVTMCIDILLQIWLSLCYTYIPNCNPSQAKKEDSVLYSHHEKTCAQNQAATQHPVCRYDGEAGCAGTTRQCPGGCYQANRSCDSCRPELYGGNHRS